MVSFAVFGCLPSSGLVNRCCWRTPNIGRYPLAYNGAKLRQKDATKHQGCTQKTCLVASIICPFKNWKKKILKSELTVCNPSLFEKITLWRQKKTEKKTVLGGDADRLRRPVGHGGPQTFDGHAPSTLW